MNRKKSLIIFTIILLSNFSAKIWSQQLNQISEFYYSQIVNERVNQSKQIIHSGFKPLLLSQLEQKQISDSLFYQDSRDQYFSDKLKSKWIYRKIRTEDFVKIQKSGFGLRINPLFNFELKKERNNNQSYFTNTRGIEFKGDIGKKLSFYSSFFENQATFVPYIADYIRETLVVPGQGSPKILKNNKFDFSSVEAYLSFSPNENFNLQFGHSKQFIGSGYRSLILSDNSFNYPFIKLSYTYKKLQYTLLWSQFQSFDEAYYNYHSRKYYALSYLSWVPAAGFEFSFIESIIWPGNTQEDNSNFNINFFNPIMFSRTLQFGLDNEKNVLVGFDAHIKIYQFAQFFAQFALDKIDKNEKAQNNYAFQVGFKHFDLLHGKLQNHKFFAQAEYNYIAPYTYSWTDDKQSYSHYNQPIAHPTGTGLKELLGTVNYQFKDLSLMIRGSYIINSIDSLNSNFGSDLFKSNKEIEGILSDIGNTPGQGIRNELLLMNCELAYLINPASNMKLFMGLNYRKFSNINENGENLYFSFGIKTNINNHYYDF